MKLLGTVSLCSLLLGAGLAKAQDGCDLDFCGPIGPDGKAAVDTSTPDITVTDDKKHVIMIKSDWANDYTGSATYRDEIRIGPGVDLSGNLNLLAGNNIVTIYHGRELGTDSDGVDVTADGSAGDAVSTSGNMTFMGGNDELLLQTSPGADKARTGVTFTVGADSEILFGSGNNKITLQVGARLVNNGAIVFGARAQDGTVSFEPEAANAVSLLGDITGSGSITFAGGNIDLGSDRVSNLEATREIGIANRLALGAAGATTSVGTFLTTSGFLRDAGEIGARLSASELLSAIRQLADIEPDGSPGGQTQGINLTGAVDLGAGTVNIWAKEAASIGGGGGTYNMYLGEAKGAISLGGGSAAAAVAMNLTVAKRIQNGVTSAGAANDTVKIAGGSGNVSLGDGANSLEVGFGSGGEYSGTYTGGSGNDTIIVGSGFAVSGNLNLGAGNNRVESAGAITESVITGLGGDDEIVLRPGGVSVVDARLGEGANKIWVVGGEGAADSRKVTLDVTDQPGAGAAAGNFIYICGDEVSTLSSSPGCGALAGSSGNRAFSVRLNAVGDDFKSNWSVVVDGRPSSVRSELSIGGDVTLASPRMPNLKLAADGRAGDSVTVTGAYMLRHFDKDTTTEGTLFELDVDTAGAGATDSLAFQGARSDDQTPGNTPVNTLFVKLVPAQGASSPPNNNASLEIVTLDGSDEIVGVRIVDQGGVPIGRAEPIVLNGHKWKLVTPPPGTTGGARSYSIMHRNPSQVIGAQSQPSEFTGDFLVDQLTIQADWPGKYTGWHGADMIIVSAGASAGTAGAAGKWTLGLGDDTIKGSGAVLADIDFGAGNDTVGNFDAGAPASDNGLALGGEIALGAGANKVMAASADKITGGDGADTIIISGSVTGAVHLGGGSGASASNVLEITGTADAGVTSEATGTDTVTLGGGAGAVNLGGGANALALNGDYTGEYIGGAGADSITLGGGAVFTSANPSTLGAGDDRVSGAGTIRSEIQAGDGDDSIGVLFDAGGVATGLDFGLSLEADVNMGDGSNILAAGKATGTINGGQGKDKVYLKPASAFAIEGLHLGGTPDGSGNRLWIIGSEGPADGRRVTVPLYGDSLSVPPTDLTDNNPGDAIIICGQSAPELAADTGCGAATGSQAFDVTLDATGPHGDFSIWERITVINADSAHQSRVGISGDLALAASELHHTTVTSADGAAGDVIRIYGDIRVDEETVFKLDAGSGGGDILRVQNGAKVMKADGSAAGLSISLSALESASDPLKSAQFDIAFVERPPSSNSGAVTITGATGGVVLLGGRAWELGEEDISPGGRATTRYYLSLKDLMTVDYVIGDSESSEDVVAKAEYRTVTVDTNWSGNYTGLDTEGFDADTVIVNEGFVASGDLWDLRGGNDTIRGGRAEISAAIKMGPGNDTIGRFQVPDGSGGFRDAPLDHGDNGLFLSGAVDLGEGENRVRAGRAASITGGSGPERIEIQGELSGGIDLGDGETSNYAMVGGVFSGAGKIASQATALAAEPSEGGDHVVLGGGGTGGVELGDGSNFLEVRGGEWSGAYLGGSGADRITVAAGATASGNLDFGDGGNQAIVAGAVTGSITMGGGDDLVASSADPASGSAGYAKALKSVGLGGGANRLWAETVESVTAGSGNDLVYLRPGAAGYSLSTLDLGGGENTVWVSGGSGGGEITLSLKGQRGQGTNTLYICGSGPAASPGSSGCGSDSPLSFHAVLDIGAGNTDWSISVDSRAGDSQSGLTVMGDLSLDAPRLESLAFGANGAAGDSISISGQYAIEDPDSDSSTSALDLGTGTVFTLEASAAGPALVADALRFSGATAAQGSSKVPVVRVLTVGSTGGQFADGDQVEIVTVDNTSDVEAIVVVAGAGGAGAIVRASETVEPNSATPYDIDGISGNGNDDLWRIWGTKSNGISRYYLHRGAPAGPLVISGGSDSVAGSVNGVVVRGDWNGDFSGLATDDMVTVNSGVTASGGTWDLRQGGNDRILGSGSISAEILMGAGNDVIGNPREAPDHPDNGLVLGSVSLGAGDNTLLAIEASGVTAGEGADTIELGAFRGGTINLGGGSTANSLVIRGGDFSGSVVSEADDETVGDSAVIGGGGASSSVALGNGLNSLTVNGDWSGTYTGGAGKDRVTIAPGATVAAGSPERRIDVGGGANEIAVQGAALGMIAAGPGNDAIAWSFGASGAAEGFASRLGAVDLGDGDNTIRAAMVDSVATGSGNDSVYLLSGAGHSVSLSLGGGSNRVFASGSGEITLSLMGTRGQGTNTLYLCDSGFASGGCADGSGGSTGSFDAVLGPDLPWDSVRVDSRAGAPRSSLRPWGSVTLEDPRMESFTLVENGSTNDLIKISGEYTIQDPEIDAATGAIDLSTGTVLSLDWSSSGGNLASDILTLEDASPGAGSSSTPTVALKVAGPVSPTDLSRGDKVAVVRVDAASTTAGVRFAFAGPDGGMRSVVVFAGPRAILGSTAQSLYEGAGRPDIIWGMTEGGLATYYLHAGFPGVGGTQVITALDGDVTVLAEEVMIQGGWGGDLTGREVADSIALEEGAVASGDLWSLLGGSDRITGPAMVSAEIRMGAGDDVIGDPNKGLDAPENGLELGGTVSLGEGNNKLWAKSAARITGGSGNDEVMLAGRDPAIAEDDPVASSGDISLGAGENMLTVSGSVGGRYIGGPDKDTVVVNSGVVSGDVFMSPDVSIGAGENALTLRDGAELSGRYLGGPGKDEITIESGGKITGLVFLGGGENLVTGSGADDKIRLSGGVGKIDLKGGKNEAEMLGSWGGDYEGGDGDDHVMAPQSSGGDYKLGGGANTVELRDAGKITGGAGRDVVTTRGMVGGDIDLGGGSLGNSLTSHGMVTGMIASSAGGAGQERDDFKILGGASGKVDLGDGENLLEIAGHLEAGYDGGTGQDVVILRPGARAVSDGSVFDLGDGLGNAVFTEPGVSGYGVMSLSLAKFRGNNLSLTVCGGEVDRTSYACNALDPGSARRFHVALTAPEDNDSGGGNRGWHSVQVLNHLDSGQADISVRGGDIVFQDGSRFGNATVSGDGRSNVIKLTGSQSFEQATTFRLDVGHLPEAGQDRVADLLDLTGATFEGVGPAVDVRLAGAALANPDLQRVDLVHISDPDYDDNNVRIARSFLRAGADIWGFADDRRDGNRDASFTTHYLKRENINLNKEAVTGQHVISASNAVASSATAAAVKPVTPAPGATQSQPDSGGTPFWTHVTMAEQTERIGMGSHSPEVEQSFWALNSGADFHSRSLESAQVTHSLFVQYGGSESRDAGSSSSSLETSLVGFGYSVEVLGFGGAYGRLLAMGSELSGDSGGGFSISGSSFSAEAGWSFRAGSSLFVTPSARVSTTEFGDLSLRSSTSTGIERSSADLGIRLDYETIGPASGGGSVSRGFYGSLNVSHDLSGGFNFTPKTEDGQDTLSIAVDTEKTWVGVEAGLSWGFGSGSRAFVEFSTASASGGDLSGSRQSYSLGFDLDW